MKPAALMMLPRRVLSKRRLRAEFEQALRSTLSLRAKTSTKISMQGSVTCAWLPYPLRTVARPRTCCRTALRPHMGGFNGKRQAHSGLQASAAAAAVIAARCGSMLSSPTQHAQHESDIQGTSSAVRARWTDCVSPCTGHCAIVGAVRWHASARGTAGEQRACQTSGAARQRMRRSRSAVSLQSAVPRPKLSAVQQRIERHAAHEEGFACKRRSRCKCLRHGRQQAVKHCKALQVRHAPAVARMVPKLPVQPELHGCKDALPGSVQVTVAAMVVPSVCAGGHGYGYGYGRQCAAHGDVPADGQLAAECQACCPYQRWAAAAAAPV